MATATKRTTSGAISDQLVEAVNGGLAELRKEMARHNAALDEQDSRRAKEAVEVERLRAEVEEKSKAYQEWLRPEAELHAALKALREYRPVGSPDLETGIGIVSEALTLARKVIERIRRRPTPMHRDDEARDAAHYEKADGLLNELLAMNTTRQADAGALQQRVNEITAVLARLL